MNDDELSRYMSDATGRLIRNVMGNCLSCPSELTFLKRFSASAKRASARKAETESRGVHVPGFLISSITTSCNLDCEGCYARANGICGSCGREEMTDGEWASVFDQAHDLGISFNILAGGEPLMRRGVVELAAERPDTVFPVFTNGTMVGDYTDLFSRCRNLIPILSVEGGREATDRRRGEGVYDRVMAAMASLTEVHVFHGASVTVTSENLDEAVSDGFVRTLKESGCGIVFFIEYVPGRCDRHRALGESDRKRLELGVERLRGRYRNMVFMSFPGDERLFGGCIGAGRGFFHINPYGEAEACPASPYHDMNLKENTLEEVLGSPLFLRIRTRGLMEGEHEGGCILAERDAQVRSLLVPRRS